MSERFRFILFIIFSITVLWFTIILLCLPQSDQIDQWQEQEEQLRRTGHIERLDSSSRKIQPPEAPYFMRFFQSKPLRKLTHLETIFYEFNPVLSLGTKILNGTIEKSQHERISLALNSINTPLDQLVKDEGDKLFAFNLLVSNRLGLSRPIPDTRPIKCPRAKFDVNQISEQTASIIICYYNEAPSALLRTIYSIIGRTPTSLI